MSSRFVKSAVLGIVALGTIVVFTDNADARHRRHRHRACCEQAYYSSPCNTGCNSGCGAYDQGQWGAPSCSPCAGNACGVTQFYNDGYGAQYASNPCGATSAPMTPQPAVDYSAARPTYQDHGQYHQQDGRVLQQQDRRDMRQQDRQDTLFQNQNQNAPAPAIRTDINTPARGQLAPSASGQIQAAPPAPAAPVPAAPVPAVPEK